MLFEALTRHAQTRPGAVAAVCGESRLTWVQWRDQALHQAASLPAAGVIPLQFPNSQALLVALLACAYQQRTALLLPADCTTSERARLLAAAQPGSFLLLPTSGTTGQPKLSPRSQAQLATLGAAFNTAAQITGDDRIFCAVPLAHGYGLCAGLLAALFSGASLYLQEKFDRRQLLRALPSAGITVLAAAPFQYNVLAATVMPKPLEVPRLRLALSGGAPLPSDLWSRARHRLGFPIRQTYGTSETGMITANVHGDPEATHTSVGHPLPGVSVAIVDGVIAVRDAGNPAGPWIPTDDLGHLDNGGRLHISGRRQDLFNIGGRKFHPAEVEAVLRAHPLVRHATVERLQSPSGEDTHKAIVVCEAPCTPEEIVAFCRERLAPHKVPRLIEVSDRQRP
jgi:long-chain acyl-CoA synthetase